jgi:tRNA (cmo5U34)-methyltransferase
MTAGAAWQQSGLVGEFLHERQTLLPMLDVQEDLVRQLFLRHGHPVRRFLDVGSGDGAMSALMFGIHPDAEAVLVDFSEPMLERAHVRLDGSGHRWSAVQADLAAPGWVRALPPGDHDAAVSSFAIHHLTAERKRALFAELFALLAPGAMFVNIDVVTIEGPLAGLFDEEMASRAIRAERSRGGSRSDEEVAAQFVNDEDEDRPDSAADQLSWLGEAGFEAVELHFKWAEGAVFGGIKPGGRT